MPGKAKLNLLIAIMAVVAVSSSLIAGWVQYDAAFTKKRMLLISMVKNERVALTEKLNLKNFTPKIFSDPDFLKNLNKHIDDDLKFDKFGKTGEFVLARQIGKQIVFLLTNHDLKIKTRKVHLESTLAEPMRRALLGHSGSMTGMDYKGDTVLAAFEPLGKIGIGIVAKINIAEIRAPFLQAGLIAALAALALMAIGAVLFYSIITPILHKARANEKQFHGLYDRTPAMMHSIDSNGNIQYVNSQWLNFMGYDRKEVIGKKIFDFQTAASKPIAKTAVKNLAKKGRVDNIPLQFINKHGKIYDVLITAISQQDDTGSHIGSLSVLTDVSEKTRIEAHLAEAVESFTGGLALYDADERFILCNENYRKSLRHLNATLKPGMTKEEQLRAAANSGAITEAIGNEEAWVTQRLNDFRHESGGYIRQNISGNWVKVDNYRTKSGGTASVRTDITDLKEAENAIQASEEKFRAVFDSIGQGILIHRNRIPLYANQALANMYGFSSVDDILALKNTGVLTAPEFLTDRHFRRIAGEALPTDMELKGVRTDGSQFWLNKRSFRIFWDGEPAMCSIRHDITGRKQAEQAIQASELRFRTLFNSCNLGILVHRQDKMIYANKSLAEIYGYDSPDEITALENSLRLVAPGSKRAYTTERINKDNYADITNDSEYQGLKKDGSTIWISKRTFGLLWDGEPAICSFRADITQRKQTEEALQKNETQFRTFVDNLPMAVNVKDIEGRYIMVNSRFEEWYGVKHDDLIGQTRSKSFGAAQEDTTNRVNAHDQEVIRTGKQITQYREHVLTDGQTHGFEISKFPIFDETGQIIRIGSISADITERKQAEDALRDSDNQFRTFTDQLPMAINIRNVDGRFVLVNKRVEEWSGLKKEAFIGKTHSEVFGAASKDRSSVVQTHVDQVIKTGLPIVSSIQRTLTDGQTIECEVRKFPIFDENGTIVRIGSITADITERVQSEEALRLSELRFRGAIESLHEAFALYDADDRLVIFNDEYMRLHPNSQHMMKPGMKFEDMIRYNVKSGINADALGREEEHIKERMERHRNPHGSIIRQLTNGVWFIINESRTPDGGYSVTETNITELKESEMALRDSEERFRTLFNSSPQGIMVHRHRKPLYSNPAFAEMHGYDSPDEILALDDTRCLLMPEYNRDHHERRLKGEKFASDEVCVGIRKDDTQFWIDKRTFLISWDGEIAACTIRTDIDQRIKAEASLRESEERFRTLFNSAPQGIMVFRNYKALYANQAFAEMYGYDSPEEIFNLKSTNLLLAPEYRRQRHERRLKGEDLPADGENENLRKDGTRFWIEKRTFLINWGGEIAACTIRTDIDQRKKAEAALRESEERLRTLFNTSPQGILVHRDHKALYTNPALAEMYGYDSPDEILKLPSTQKLIMPEHRRPVSDTLALEKGDSYDREYQGQRKNGEAIWVQKRSFVISWDGKPALCSMRTDITESKEASETIRRSEEQFRVAIAGLQEGFALYDADDRLVIYNEEFVRLHPGATDAIHPGMTWGELLNATLESGLNAQALGREDEYRRERTKLHKYPKGPIVRQTVDGAWRIVNEAKLPDGGTVAVQTDITALKKLEDEALSAQTRLLAAIESIEGGFSLYGPDDRLILSNSNNAIFFSDVSDLYKPGIRFDEILRARADRGLIDGIEGNIEDWVEARLKRFHQRKPSVHLRQDRGRWMQINQYPTSDGGKAMIRTDITDSKEMMDALHESEERFKTLIDSSNQGIIIHRNNKPLYANAALARMFGHKSPKEIMALPSTKKLLQPAKKSNSQLNIGLTTNEDEFLTTKKDGTSIWVNNRAFKIDWEGKPSICTTLFDITERKVAESQLIQSSKLASLGELASSVAHELNQPLSISRIVAESTMMKAEEGTIDSEYLQKQLSSICDQAERMANITNHLRMFSRMDEGDVTLFDPAESLANAINLIDQPFRLSGIKLTKRLPKDTHPVLGSGFKLEQVILNLMNNAADAVNDEVERKEDAGENYTPRISIHLSDNKKSKEIVIRVRDNGGGVSKEYLEKIFEPFFTTKLADQGTGLGLSISFGIVKSMQGTLTAENDKNGALFTIRLPAQPAVKDSVKRKSATSKPTRQQKSQNGKNKKNGNGKNKQNGNGESRHILVVDDEPLAAESIAEHLEYFGYQVQTASNGAEALTICDNDPPDVVITDLRMPIMDGFELIRELKNHHPKLPIIVTTGHANLEEEEEAVTDGASAVLWKPIRLNDLTQKLTELIN